MKFVTTPEFSLIHSPLSKAPDKNIYNLTHSWGKQIIACTMVITRQDVIKNEKHSKEGSGQPSPKTQFTHSLPGRLTGSGKEISLR